MRFSPSKSLISLFLAVFCGLAFFAPASSVAQAPPDENLPARFETQARAANSVTVMAGSAPIRLWAVEAVGDMGAAFNLRARTALDNAMGQAKITCETKNRAGDRVFAQCVNKQDQDLGLFMLQQGFATVDRASVFGTVFEDAYIQAEMQAQSRGAGVWAGDGGGKNDAAGGDGLIMLQMGFGLFMCIIIAFMVLSVTIMRGFRKIIDAQNQNAEMSSKERKLREKEKGVVAVMLDSEIKANKAKIEAYRVVYEEMLRGLKDSSRPAKYKKSGDIIQKQPALTRSVFDRNTDKLDMMGDRLSSQLIHFYARVKSAPEYITLEANAPVEEVIALLEKSLKNAERLNALADKVLESFASGGVVSENYDYAD